MQMIAGEQAAAVAPVVFVVDDNASMREALKRLLSSVGLRAETFASAAEFMEGARPEAPSCLVLDVRMPGLSGLDFQVELIKTNVRIPIVFMSGHGDIPMSVKAMKAGAVEFLTKPFRDQDMLDAIRLALDFDRSRRENEKVVAEARGCFNALTPREREVMGLVTTGLLNREIAAMIGVSEITIKVHRGKVMQKMGARSMVDLVRKAELLKLRPTK